MIAEQLAQPCLSGGDRISSPIIAPRVMNPVRISLRPFVAGLALTLAQIFLAVAVLAPSGPWPDRYRSLVQHDSYWFANIVERGYATTVPPINQKLMEVSNVAFFPAYPAIVAVLHYGLKLATHDALLITAQSAAFGFWSYFFLFCDRWNISPLSQTLGALLIVAHPAAFFLVAGYSESLFLMALIGFMYWSSAEGRAAKWLAVAHGFLMSATRIVGVPCAAFPVVRAIFERGWNGLRDLRGWFRNYGGAILIMCASMLGAISFFVYCLFRWSRWDMYMLTQEAGWAIDPDYFAVFKPENYRWLIPDFDDPRAASQLTMALTAILFIMVALCEILPAIRRRTAWQNRIAFYFCAWILYYIAVSGVACVQMESMLRYEFCVHAVIVLAFLHFLRQFRAPSLFWRACGIAAAVLVSAAGLGLQGWYVWNFTRGNWIA